MSHLQTPFLWRLFSVFLGSGLFRSCRWCTLGQNWRLISKLQPHFGLRLSPPPPGASLGLGLNLNWGWTSAAHWTTVASRCAWIFKLLLVFGSTITRLLVRLFRRGRQRTQFVWHFLNREKCKVVPAMHLPLQLSSFLPFCVRACVCVHPDWQEEWTDAAALTQNGCQIRDLCYGFQWSGSW